MTAQTICMIQQRMLHKCKIYVKYKCRHLLTHLTALIYVKYKCRHLLTHLTALLVLQHCNVLHRHTQSLVYFAINFN